jgi:hypothetical protein
MSGITVGARQFNMQAPAELLSATDQTPYRTLDGGTGLAWYIEQKLDLRGLNGGGDESRGLNPLSIQLQESLPYHCSTTEGAPFTPSFMVYDVLSTVPLNVATLNSIFRWPQNQEANSNPPGFLVSKDFDMSEFRGARPQVLNTSQVIWGRWRQFHAGKEWQQGTDAFGTKLNQSGNWGSGEIMVSNDAYYYRLISTNSDNNTVKVPSVNLAIWAEVVKLSEGQELTQLSRMVQR